MDDLRSPTSIPHHRPIAEPPASTRGGALLAAREFKGLDAIALARLPYGFASPLTAPPSRGEAVSRLRAARAASRRPLHNETLIVPYTVTRCIGSPTWAHPEFLPCARV